MKGDFLGFTFVTSGNVYTNEDLGIVRTSDGGDGYEDQLTPEINDKTVEIPGADGSYFYGSDFRSKQFSINFAFDSLTEGQLRNLRQVFGYKHTGALIFDERPYKQYLVKVSNVPELNYVCIDQQERIASNIPQDGIRWTQHEEWTIKYNTISESVNANTEKDVIVSAPPSENPTFLQVDSIEVSFNDEEGVLTYIKNGTTLRFINSETNPETDPIQVTISYQYLERTQEGEHEKVYPYEYTDNIERIYRGTGSVEFTAYYPYAKQVYKYLNECTDENVDEWKESSNLLENNSVLIGNQSGHYDTYYMEGYPKANKEIPSSTDISVQKKLTGQVILYNGGDISTGFRWFIPWVYLDGTEIKEYNAGSGRATFFPITLINTGTGEQLSLSKIYRRGNDVGFQINTENGLIEGMDCSNITKDGTGTTKFEGLITSGNIYNDCIKGGEFFKIEPGETTIVVECDSTAGTSAYTPQTQLNHSEINYDYLYF